MNFWLILLALGGLASALVSLIPAIGRHRDPYATYVDNSPQAMAGTRRNYCFGPGYRQVLTIVKDAAAGQVRQLKMWKEWREKAHDWVDYRFEWPPFLIGGFICVYASYGFLVVATAVLGFTFIGVIAILLCLGMFAVMTGFFLVFGVLWLIDRSLLALRSIQSRCPNCKERCIVPVFVCGNCGQPHRNLTPGPYGVAHRRCSCGARLATMYLTGRSRLEARCPRCSTEVAASDAQQFGIQLVGSVASGKSAFLAAFWHEYLARVRRVPGLSVRLEPEDAFADLEEWYRRGEAPATAETNSPMYSAIHAFADKTPVQMTIYDIAGEAFTQETLAVRQQQFGYCEGIVFAIDPTTDPREAVNAIQNFAKEFTELTGKRASKLADVPVAAMITKADLLRRDIGLPRIKALFKTSPEAYQRPDGSVVIDDIRNEVCRQYLYSNGFGNVVNWLDAQFGTLQFYPVSAIGHLSKAGDAYQPWGVLEPVGWLIQRNGEGLFDVLPELLEGELSGVPQIKRSRIPIPW